MMSSNVIASSGDAARRTGRGDRERTVPVVLALVAVACVAVTVLPVGVTILEAFGGGLAPVEAAFATPALGSLLGHSLLVAAVATPLCGLLGVLSAWLTERTRLPGRRVWAVLLVAPLAVPLFVTSYAWATLSPSLQGFTGAVGIIVFAYSPIVFLVVSVALRRMDPALEESARALGLNGRRIFLRVVLPQLRPALLGGMLLVALDTLVEFDAFVGLRFQTFSTDVYSQYQLSFSASGAAALSLISTAFCVLLLVSEARLRGRSRYSRINHGAQRPPIRYSLGRSLPIALTALAAIVAVGLGISVWQLAHWFSESSRAGLDGASSDLRYLAPATLTSLGLGAGSAALAVLLALPVALLAVRYGGLLSFGLERATYLAFALPDLVAAIALAYATSHHARFLSSSVALLILADAVLFVPFALVALRATLGQLEPALEDAARSLGAGAVRAFMRVTLPLARPGIAAAGVLVFAFVLGDISTTQVLLPPDLYTLGTEFQENSLAVSFAAAAPFAAALIALALAATWALMSWFGRVRSPESS